MIRNTLIFCFIVSLSVLKAQSQTIGLLQHSAGSNDDGYILFSPVPSTSTYLIDKCGKLIHTWTSSYTPGQSVYLLPDGNLLRTGNINNSIFNAGGSGGIVEKLDWNSNILWSYQVSDFSNCQHHDIEPLPNGNVLVIAWEKKTVAKAVAAGRNPANLTGSLWSEQILEIQPIGTNSAIVVWEWHLWDHLVQNFDNSKANYGSVSGSPQLMNINFPPNSNNVDWIHLNSIDYNPSLDQIIISAHNINEIWVIDHSTTSLQASGHTGGNSGKGGDILYRWGNPAAYSQGTLTDKKFFGQHSAYWIEQGFPFEDKIMVFNNGLNRPGGNYSNIDIISTPIDSLGNYFPILPYQPDSACWSYADPVPANFFSSHISGAQQLINGNVLICNGGNGEFFEIDSNKNTVWRYINPVSGTGIMSQGDLPINNSTFRCSFYPSNYSGFAGHNLIAGQPIELNPLPYSCILDSLTTNISPLHCQGNEFFVFPNPATEFINISTMDQTYVEGEIIIYNTLGSKVYNDFAIAANTKIDITNFPCGLYLIKYGHNFARFFKN